MIGRHAFRMIVALHDTKRARTLLLISADFPIRARCARSSELGPPLTRRFESARVWWDAANHTK